MSVAPQHPITPDFSVYVSWPLRWERFRDGAYRDACLASLIADATAVRNNDWLDAAQACLDTGENDELDALIAEQDLLEEFEEWRAAGRDYGIREATRREYTDFADWKATRQVGGAA